MTRQTRYPQGRTVWDKELITVVCCNSKHKERLTMGQQGEPIVSEVSEGKHSLKWKFRDRKSYVSK